MKINWIKKGLSVVLAGAMVICLAATAGVPTAVYAEETEGSGKYVSDVFIAYGKSEKKATEWLQKNGWEPVKGDFNAGKASFFDDNKIQDQNVAAVMGIKRTDDKEQAITDMAVMNMKGGYSLPEYEKLIDEKKAEINEFINHFMVVIEEYRANYNGEGSEFGKKRAETAHDMLNNFTDGGEDEEYAVNDTGMKMGDGLLEKTRQEGNEAGIDLEQLLLESSGPAMLIVETLLALSADVNEQTWIERAGGLTGEELAENLVQYAPEAEGQDVAESAVPQFLGQKYGDTAAVLADQWGAINEQMRWFESYCNQNDLWEKDGDSTEAYDKRLNDYFDNLKKSDEAAYNEESKKFGSCSLLYDSLYECHFEGEWGETMGDFFNPSDEAYSYPEAEAFLPMAAALSDGQRASMDFLSLQALLLIGFGSDEGLKKALPEIDKTFGDIEDMSIYTGVNRAAFRGGVAITSEALMEQNAGKGQAFDQMWDNMGIVAISSYCAAIAGIVSMIAGGVMVAKGTTTYTVAAATRGGYQWKLAQSNMNLTKNVVKLAQQNYDKGLTTAEKLTQVKQNALDAEKDFQALDKTTVTETTKMGYAGRIFLGVGGALLVGAAIVKAVQMYKYYQRDMTPIPRMIVDESDIVTYLTDDNGKPILDENGEQKKNIDFKTYEYYSAVKCNRPEVGEIGDWQDGVSDYKDPEHYCFDIADLNADMGQEWIALYTVKSQDKGDPILADSLTLQYGSSKTPKGCTKPLHLFTYTNAVDLGDTAWAFNNDKKGVYLFWDADTNAFAADAASAFSGGQLALAGIGGLILGIAGATLVLNKKRRKDEPEAA